MVRNLLGVLGAVIAIVATVGLALGFLAPFEYDLDAFAHIRPQVSLALLIAALFTAIDGRRRLARAALGAGLFGFVALGPIWRFAEALPETCPQGRLTVATANVEYNNLEPAALVASLLASNADLIAVQELNDAFWAEAGPLLAVYPYTALDGDPADYPGGAGIFSRRPIRVIEAASGEDPVLHRALAAATVGGREIGVASFHFDRPLVGPQEEQVLAFDRYALRLTEPRILLGDFNATPWSFAVDEIQRRGKVEIAPGLRRTWRRAYPTPFFGIEIPAPFGNQIDHVFLSPGLGVESIETFELPGSPHWGVKAVIQIPADPGGCQ